MKQKVHPVNPFIYVPMPAEPGDVPDLLLNPVQPVFRACVNTVLINHRKEYLSRLIFVRASMRQDDIERLLSDLLLYICPSTKDTGFRTKWL